MATEPDAADLADMRALQQGDELALNRIMERHRDKLFHYLIRLLQDETEALDIAQEAFVRLYLNRDKFRLNQRLTSWLYSIATNLAKDRLRWLSRHPNVSLHAPATGTDQTLADTLAENRSAPSEALLQEERAREVRRALAEMPEELRTPLVLVEYEELAQAEVAEILRCSPKAVENRLYRARKLLREKLKSLFEIPGPGEVRQQIQA